MVRKVIIEAILVPESLNTWSKEIEKEILKEIRHGPLSIPWCSKVEKVRVVEQKGRKRNVKIDDS